MKLHQLVRSLGMSDAQIADEVQKMSGQIITRKLITYALDGEPIPALKAQALSDWLSKEFGRKLTPGAIGIKIHAFSALPDKTEESIGQNSSKIAGFMAGFSTAYVARHTNKSLSNAEIDHLAEQASKQQNAVFQESDGDLPISQNAFRGGYRFGAIGLDSILSQPGGAQKYQKLRAMSKEDREEYARSMARDLLEYY